MFTGILKAMMSRKNLFLATRGKRLRTRGRNLTVGKRAKIRGAQAIDLGDNVTIAPDTVINCVTQHAGKNHSPRLRIGNNVLINVGVHIGCAESIDIEDNVVTSARCQIIDHNHGYENPTTPILEQPLQIKGGIVIEDNCWLATGVVVCSGVRIGTHSVIGANSVVTHDVPPHSLVGGVPAKVIRDLSGSPRGIA